MGETRQEDALNSLPLFLRKTLAWGVHFFTATGAIWGFLAILAIFDHEWKLAILWMALAIFVDGFDGMLARWADVKTHANGIDGALLDNILDYFNYVVVPAFFLLKAELLPGSVAMFGALSILITSAYQFTQTDAKTEDHYFKGFPSYWNVAAIYMLVLELNPWVNFAFLMLFNVLVFVPVKYVYPTRTTRLKRLTLMLTYFFGAVGLLALILYPNEPKWLWWLTLTYGIYYVGLSLWPQPQKMEA